MKVCTKCGEEKDESEFHKRKGSSDGLRGQCKKCKNECRKDWEKNNPERVKASKKKYKEDNPEKVEEANKNWRNNNREVYNEIQRRWRKNNPESYKKSRKKHEINNREKILQAKREYMQRNREYFSRQSLKMQKIRDSEDPIFHLVRRMRGSFRNVMKGMNSRTMSHIVHSDLFTKLEMQFEPGMTWDNYGRESGNWVVDHKKPIARFIEQGEHRPHVIFAICNLQPMWVSENCSKQDKFQSNVSNRET